MLGASGKLGRGLLASADRMPDQAFEIIPVRRETAGNDAVCWQPGEPTEALPASAVVLALWGVTGGNPQALARNETLAREAVAVGRAVGAHHVLHCSSAAVYGRTEGPLHEDLPCTPANAYGAAKCAMEAAIRELEGEAVQTILRIANVAGADSLFGNMRPGGRVTLDRFSSGSGPSRSYIAPCDLWKALLAVIQTRTGGTLNLAAPGPTSMQAIAEEAGCTINWREAPASALESVDLDTGRLATLCPLPDSAADAAHLVADARLSGLWP